MAILTTNAKIDSNSPSRPRTHLPFLDGLRGLAALYITLHHAYLENAGWGAPDANLSRPVAHLTNWLLYGHYAVSVFIVLSGYCLMLPIMQTPDNRLRGGIKQFLWRRAKRILPAYYAAVVLSLILIYLLPGLRHITGDRWDVALPAFTRGVLVSHLFLFQNIRWEWATKIDYSLWSVATEWQIYFVFALLLLPLWQRFGIGITVVIAFVIGLIPHFIWPQCDIASFWFLGLFALGMGGAVINFSQNTRYQDWAQRMKWGVISSLCALLFWVLTEVNAMWLLTHEIVADILVGLISTSFIIYCVNQVAVKGHASCPTIIRLLESRGAMALGAISYSLYLVHPVVLAIFHLALRPLHLKASLDLVFMLSVGILLSLLITYVFHYMFERPFLSSVRRQEVIAETTRKI